MRMKMFAADTFDAARALVLAEMGTDAVILSEREIDGRVEVRAATNTTRRSGNDRPIFLRNERAEKKDDDAAILEQRLRDAMAWHGASKRFTNKIISLADTSLPDPTNALATGLMEIVSCRPLKTRPQKNIVLVGPPGHGRTSAAAKLTRRAAMAGEEILPVAADFDATAGGDQLSAYLALERAQVRIAADPDALFKVMEEIESNDERCVIDLPPILPFHHEDLAALKDLVGAINAEPILVLSAEGHPADQAEAARAYAAVGIKRAILTKLDVARRRGGAISALAAARISLSHLAITPFIGGGLIEADASKLANLLMEDASAQDALRGAA